MAYIVLDMEWNQNGFHQKCPVNKDGVTLRNEIIQIGAVKLDSKLQHAGTFKADIRLPRDRRLNKYVARVVQVEEKDLRQGDSFPDAIRRFRRWCGVRPVFLTWGFDDIPVLDHNLSYYGINTRWTRRWYNAQMLYAWQHLEQKQQVSLMRAVEDFNFFPCLPAHDALNDALYASMICQKLDVTGGIGAYTAYMQPVKKAPAKRRRRHRRRRSGAAAGAAVAAAPVAGAVAAVAAGAASQTHQA